MHRVGYDGNEEVIEGLATASSIRGILAPVQATVRSPVMSMSSPPNIEGLETVGAKSTRPPPRPTDVAALSSGTTANPTFHNGYSSLRSPEVSVRAAVPRYSRGADPPPLASSSSFLGPSPQGGAVGSKHSLPVRPASVVPAPSSSSNGRQPGPRVSGGGMHSEGTPEMQQSSETPMNLTPSLGSGRPGNVPQRVFPGSSSTTNVTTRSRSLEAVKPVMKANVLSVTASGAPPERSTQAPLLSSSRSLVPPPARVASNLVPSASRYFSYAPAVVRSPEVLASKPSSFTPSITRVSADMATANTTHGEDRHVAPIRFLEGLHRPATSPLLVEEKGESSRVAEDPLISSVRHFDRHPGVAIEGLSSGHGAHPSAIWAYPSKPSASSSAQRPSATKVEVAPREGPPELDDFRRPASNYVEFGSHHWPEPYVDNTASQEVSLEDRFPMFFGNRELPFPSTAVGAVPNTAPPLMRYTVNPKDGCLEKTQDTQQPAHVPAVAAAAMAAVTAASGKNALFPNFAEREKERDRTKEDNVTEENGDISEARVEGDCQQESSVRGGNEQVGEGDEFEQKLKAELEAARTKRAEAVKRLMHPNGN